MIIAAQIIGAETAVLNIGARKEAVSLALVKEVTRLSFLLADKVKTDFLTGQALKVQTGRLRRSIVPKVVDEGGLITGIVGTNVEYAAIHELGGQTRPHRIEPKNKKALAWALKGAAFTPRKSHVTSTGRMTLAGKKAMAKQGMLQFAKGVNHPGSKIPERSFLRAALNAMTSEIREGLEAAIKGALE